jgi:hypothetical protein
MSGAFVRPRSAREPCPDVKAVHQARIKGELRSESGEHGTRFIPQEEQSGVRTQCVEPFSTQKSGRLAPFTGRFLRSVNAVPVADCSEHEVVVEPDRADATGPSGVTGRSSIALVRSQRSGSARSVPPAQFRLLPIRLALGMKSNRRSSRRRIARRSTCGSFDLTCEPPRFTSESFAALFLRCSASRSALGRAFASSFAFASHCLIRLLSARLFLQLLHHRLDLRGVRRRLGRGLLALGR